MRTYLALGLALFLPLAALADGDDHDDPKPTPPPIVCEDPDFCPSLDRLLESETFAGLDCKSQTKTCKRVASIEYACNRAVIRTVFRTARRKCETRECQRFIRDGLVHSLDELRAKRKAGKLACRSVCSK